MDGDFKGYTFAKVFVHGSQGYAYVNQFLTIPSMKCLGLFPCQMTSRGDLRLTCMDLGAYDLIQMNGFINANSINYPYTQFITELMVGSIYLKKTTSLGGCWNMSVPMQTVLDYLNRFPVEILCLEPKDGIVYYEHNEQISFENALKANILETDIKSARFDLPNFIVNKAIAHFNETFQRGMHSISFLVPTNPSRFEQLTDDIQIIQTNNLSYIIVHYQRTPNSTTIYYFNEDISPAYAQQFISTRYPNSEIVMQGLNQNSRFNDQKYSGIWAVIYCTNIFNNLPMVDYDTDIDNISNWLYNLTEHKRMIPFVQN